MFQKTKFFRHLKIPSRSEKGAARGKGKLAKGVTLGGHRARPFNPRRGGKVIDDSGKFAKRKVESNAYRFEEKEEETGSSELARFTKEVFDTGIEMLKHSNEGGIVHEDAISNGFPDRYQKFDCLTEMTMLYAQE